MGNVRRETDAEKILRFIAYSAGAHQPVHPLMILQVAIRILEFYRSYEGRHFPPPNARHCIDLGQHQVQLMRKRCSTNPTIGCLVAAAIYIIIRIDDKKIAWEDTLALDIQKTLSKSFDIRFDDVVVEQIIKEIQEYKRTAPPTFNPFAEFDAMAKGKNLAHVDWLQLLTELDKYQNLSNEKFPYYIMLHGFLRAIPRPIDRVDILGYLEDAAEQIFAPGKAKEFVTGARSLVALYTKVNSRGLNHPIKKHWADSDLNEFTMLMETITPQEFVAISQSMVEARVVTHVRCGFIPHILRHENYLGEIVTKSGYEFCRGLYHAEGLREWLISGEGDNYDQLPSLDTLELEFINECYDIFIDYHTKGIKKTYTNIQQRDKNEYEYYRELLENLKHEFKELPADEIHSKDARTIKAHKSVRARFRDLIKYVEQRVKTEKAKHAPIQMVKSETANTNDENVGNLPNTPTIKDLEKVFLPCYTKINDCGMLLNILIEKRDNVSDPEWARYALTIYESKKIFKNYPKSFKEWLPIFCTLFGREVDYRAPSNIKRTICETDITPFLPKLM